VVAAVVVGGTAVAGTVVDVPRHSSPPAAVKFAAEKPAKAPNPNKPVKVADGAEPAKAPNPNKPVKVADAAEPAKAPNPNKPVKVAESAKSERGGGRPTRGTST
jgi:cell division septation protein DedD